MVTLIQPMVWLNEEGGGCKKVRRSAQEVRISSLQPHKTKFFNNKKKKKKKITKYQVVRRGHRIVCKLVFISVFVLLLTQLIQRRNPQQNLQSDKQKEGEGLVSNFHPLNKKNPHLPNNSFFFFLLLLFLCLFFFLSSCCLAPQDTPHLLLPTTPPLPSKLLILFIERQNGRGALGEWRNIRGKRSCFFFLPLFFSFLFPEVFKHCESKTTPPFFYMLSSSWHRA